MPLGSNGWVIPRQIKVRWAMHVFTTVRSPVGGAVVPCTPLAATTMAPSMLERPSLSFFIDSGISLLPCFFTWGASSRPTQPATVHTPSTANHKTNKQTNKYTNKTSASTFTNRTQTALQLEWGARDIVYLQVSIPYIESLVLAQ